MAVIVLNHFFAVPWVCFRFWLCHSPIIQEVSSEGVQLHFDAFFFHFWFLAFYGGGGGGEDQNITESGQPSARQRNAIEMSFCWRTDDDPTLKAGFVFQGIRTGIARKPYILRFFRRGGGPHSLPLPLWIRACVLFSGHTYLFLHNLYNRMVAHL